MVLPCSALCFMKSTLRSASHLNLGIGPEVVHSSPVLQMRKIEAQKDYRLTLQMPCGKGPHEFTAFD